MARRKITPEDRRRVLLAWIKFSVVFYDYLDSLQPAEDDNPDQKRDNKGRFSKGAGGKNIDGLLGEAFTGYKGKAAIDKLLKEKRGYVPKAFYNKNIGDIALIWGSEDTNGLAHIIKRRKEQGINLNEFLKTMINVIEKGKLGMGEKGRLTLTLGKHQAIISPNFHGKKLQFLFTAFEIDRY